MATCKSQRLQLRILPGECSFEISDIKNSVPSSHYQKTKKMPRIRTMKRGKRAVKSHPALIEFAEMLVPSWAIMNPNEMNQTPNRVELDGSSSKNRPRRSMGDQMASP